MYDIFSHTFVKSPFLIDRRLAYLETQNAFCHGHTEGYVVNEDKTHCAILCEKPRDVSTPYWVCVT